MATTAVVNPRRGRGGRFVKGGRKRSSRRPRRRRRHNYGAAMENPRRRKRRRHANPARSYYKRRRSHSRRRRRNPGISPYSSGGYRRSPNPGMFDVDELMSVVPAATGGVVMARWGLKQAGAFEAEKDGTLVPGLKHAAAIWIAAHLGGQMLGSLLGDASKGNVARIAALGYGGDLFLRTRFMRDNEWLKNNVSLQGPEYGDADELNGFQSQSALGAVFQDAMGNNWTQDGSGNWVLAGTMGAPELVEHNGTLYQVLSGMGLDSQPGSGSRLAGFQAQSSLGMARARSSRDSSFGYSTGD
jgi:hypothetical protein